MAIKEFKEKIMKETKNKAVPVVRCSNCIYLHILNDKIYYARCEMTNTVFESFKLDTRTHFCSLGKKKEENLNE